MPSTYTLNNGIELIGDGEQSGTWGDTTNTNLTLIDTSLDGHTTITLSTAGTSGSPNNLPITDGTASNGRNRALIFTDGADLGADAYVQLTPNDAKKILFVRNSLNGSRNLILFQGTYNASNDFVLAAGKDAIVKFDGAGSGAVASAVLADFALDAATITTISNTTLNTTTANATTVDTTNLEVTNLKAKDGSNAGSIADSTGVVTLASSVLTTTDINGGTIDGVTIGGSSAGAGTFTNLTASGAISFAGATTSNGGTVTTIDINGGTIDNTVIGGSSANAITGTTITGSSFVSTGDMTFGDNDKAIFGAGSDLQIYSDGTKSYLIESGTGDLEVRATDLVVKNAGNTKIMASFNDGGAVQLRYDNNVKLATTATGVDVTGTVTADGLTVDGQISQSGASPAYTMVQTDTTDLNTRIQVNGQSLSLFTINDALNSTTTRLQVNNSTGDISFYEDTGTTPKFFWDASAEALGIGTSSPSEKLHVVSAGTSALRLEATNTSTAPSINFYGKDAGGTTYQTGNINSAGSSGSLEFSADPTDAETNTRISFKTDGSERMRIDSSGNVGIGTTSPSATLHVVGQSGTGAAFIGSGDYGLEIGTYNASTETDLVFSSNAIVGSQSSLSFVAETGGFHRFMTGGTSHKTGTSGASETMRIDSSGNVGIGTSSPAHTLHIQESIASDDLVYFNNTSANASDVLRLNTSGVGSGTNILDVQSGGTSRFLVRGDGNVGIGTSSPTQKLDLEGAAGARVAFTDTGTRRWSVGNDGTSFTIKDESGAAEAMRIDSSGNVGIGTISPASALDVTGTAVVRGTVKVGDGAGGNVNADELVLSKDATNVGMSLLAADATGVVRFYLGSQTDTTAAKIQHTESNDRLFVQAKGDLHFQTGGTNTTMTLNTSGDLDVTGALSKGSGSFKIDHPLKPDTHHLVHSFIEGPQADNLYRGTVALVGGAATVNLDTAGRMTEGTFVALNGNVQCFTTNEQGWTAVKGSVSGNILTIEAQDATCTDTVSWMVVGERHDQHMLDTAWTDAEGRVITEPEKIKDQQEDDA